MNLLGYLSSTTNLCLKEAVAQAADQKGFHSNKQRKNHGGDYPTSLLRLELELFEALFC